MFRVGQIIFRMNDTTKYVICEIQRKPDEKWHEGISIVLQRPGFNSFVYTQLRLREIETLPQRRKRKLNKIISI